MKHLKYIIAFIILTLGTLFIINKIQNPDVLENNKEIRPKIEDCLQFHRGNIKKINNIILIEIVVHNMTNNKVSFGDTFESKEKMRPIKLVKNMTISDEDHYDLCPLFPNQNTTFHIDPQSSIKIYGIFDEKNHGKEIDLSSLKINYVFTFYQCGNKPYHSTFEVEIKE